MRDRVVTALVLASTVLAVVACTAPWPVFAVCVLVGYLSLEEIRAMLGHRRVSVVPALLGLGLAACLFFGIGTRVTLLTAAAILSLVGIATSSRSARHLSSPGTLTDGLWATAPLFCLLSLHQSRLGGGLWAIASPILLSLVPVWAGDTAAIFAGRAFGKHKMAPGISPNKTWEGSIANLAAASLMGALMGSWVGVGSVVGLACGVLAGVLGQLGDLFESSIKRKAGVKDSGSLLPGHGGIMDRIDSVLFVAPAVALVLALAQQR